MATPEAQSENTPPRSRAPMQLVGERVSPDQTLSGFGGGDDGGADEFDA